MSGIAPNLSLINYIEGVKQVQRAAKQGALEPIYYNSKQVFEGSNSNIFAVINDELLTPPETILKGVTRQVLLNNLKLNMPIKEVNFTRDQLLVASEVFLTGSAKEVVPVTIIDNQPIGNGQVGPVTKEVMQQFRALTEA